MKKNNFRPTWLAACLLLLGHPAYANPCTDKSWLAETVLAHQNDEGHGLGGTGNHPGESDHGIGGTGRSGEPIPKKAPPTRLATHRSDPSDGSGIGGTGIIGIIAGFGSICVNGQEIHYDANTPISRDGQPGRGNELAIGQRVAVQATAIAQGEFSASHISVLHEVIGPAHFDEQGLSVLGQRIRLNNERAETGLSENQLLAISGHRLPDGAILATRIEVRQSAPLTLNGTVSTVSETGFTIGKQTITSKDTSRLQIGQALRVQGHLVDGVLQADVLQTTGLESWLPGQRALLLQGYVRGRAKGLVDIDGLGVHLPADWAGELAPGSRVSINARIDGEGRAVGERIRIEQERPGINPDSKVSRQQTINRPRAETTERSGSEVRPLVSETLARPQTERDAPARLELLRPEVARPEFERPSSLHSDLPLRNEALMIERIRIERGRPEAPPRPR